MPTREVKRTVRDTDVGGGCEDTLTTPKSRSPAATDASITVDDDSVTVKRRSGWWLRRRPTTVAMTTSATTETAPIATRPR